MKKAVSLVVVVITFVIFSSCAELSEQEIAEPTATWREAYAALLRQYEEKGDLMFFLLHDFDKDGTPELIIMGEYADNIYDAVYTFRDGEILSLEYGEGVEIAGFALAANGGVWATNDNAPGLITYLSGASSLWGRNLFASRIIIYGDNLVVDVFGGKFVDVNAQGYTRWHINDNTVSEEEFDSEFGVVLDTNARLSPLRITESNIRETIKEL